MSDAVNKATALMIIDVQVGIIADPRAYKSNDVLEKINSLIAKARAFDIPIIYIQHDGPEGHRVEPGSKGWPIHEAIAPDSCDLVIHKRASDSFFETALHRELEARGVKHFAVAGCMTEYCVDTTCRRAVSLGYDVTLAADAHTTYDTPSLTAAQIISHHNRLLDGFDAGRNLITVKTSEEIAF